MNVTVPDGLTWNKGFDDLTRRIRAGWKTKDLRIDELGWKKEYEFWAGPDNRGRWEPDLTGGLKALEAKTGGRK